MPTSSRQRTVKQPTSNARKDVRAHAARDGNLIPTRAPAAVL
jgi:hypothetical protein